MINDELVTHLEPIVAQVLPIHLFDGLADTRNVTVLQEGILGGAIHLFNINILDVEKRET